MVARKFAVRFNDADFDVDYDTDDGLEVFKYQLFSLTSIPPDQQKIVSGEHNRVVADDPDLVEISDKIRLVSIEEDGVGTSRGESGIGNEKLSGGFEMSDEELARMLQAEEDALLLQQYIAEEDNGQMERRIRPYISQVMMYEDPNYQEAARKTVPTDELEEKALIALAKEGNFAPTKNERDHAFLLQLLLWFKQSFSWVHSPSCETCGSETINEGMGDALDSEKQYGGYRVELYRCRSCSRITRFPRYNNPSKLLETRRGRCGEWANCFTLYCRTFGYDSRLILDFTDHVWTECFSNHLGRWMHLDPCEGIHDKPLLYEKGWNKKLDYVIAIANDGVYDVTKRYTRKWHEVLLRRTITTEDFLSSILTNLTKESRKGFPADLLLTLEGRDRNEREILERTAHGEDDTSVSLPGRLSGNKEWRISRSECGESDSFSSSNCPVRQCVDAHVTEIYNAFSPFLAEFVDNHHSMSKAIDALKILKDLLKDLKNSPYASRRASIKPVVSKFIVRNMLQSFVRLLNALHLKHESTSSGEVVITLANDPVKTSLALPVAFDALVDMIQTLKNSGEISKDSLSLPTTRLNRIHSGSVLASGEELPFGIATSAFDGISLSKWEEPNGAKGAWIVYKLADDKKCELVAYEFMSANDAPERDPMDWVVEGSDDGGCSWHIIDKQTFQKFEDRFQRKTYKVTSLGVESNTFRFRFLAVRDSASTSRLQIGSIDLYSLKA